MPADDTVAEEKSGTQGSEKPVILLFKDFIIVTERSK